MGLQTSGPFLVLILHLHQVKQRKRKARESAIPIILNRARKRITHPLPLSHCSVSFCVLGRAHSCALCAPSGRRGESRRAGDGNPALLLLCSNWPQQPAAASRSDFLLLLSIISERGQAAGLAQTSRPIAKSPRPALSSSCVQVFVSVLEGSQPVAQPKPSRRDQSIRSGFGGAHHERVCAAGLAC